MRVAVAAVGLCAPGLDGWKQSGPVLAGCAPYRGDAAPVLSRGFLPRNENRRASRSARLALQAAFDALACTAVSPAELASVFACSGGDTESLDNICTALTLPGRPVSPNSFNNSVHNAPAGYWSIASRSRAPSISLAAYDATFAAGLLEAAGQTLATTQPVLLVAYDVPPPPPLLPFRRVQTSFAVALLLNTADSPERRYRMRLTIGDDMFEDRLENSDLEALRLDNPAARSLPLLTLFAKNIKGNAALPYLPVSRLLVECEPC